MEVATKQVKRRKVQKRVKIGIKNVHFRAKVAWKYWIGERE